MSTEDLTNTEINERIAKAIDLNRSTEPNTITLYPNWTDDLRLAHTLRSDLDARGEGWQRRFVSRLREGMELRYSETYYSWRDDYAIAFASARQIAVAVLLALTEEFEEPRE